MKLELAGCRRSAFCIGSFVFLTRVGSVRLMAHGRSVGCNQPYVDQPPPPPPQPSTRSVAFHGSVSWKITRATHTHTRTNTHAPEPGGSSGCLLWTLPPPPTPHTRSSAPRTCWQLTTTALACYETAAGTSNRRRPIIRSPGRANTPAAILRGQTASNCCSSCSLSLSLSLYFPQVLLLLFSCCTCAQMSLQVVVNINACVQTRAPVRIESFLFSVFQSKEFKVVCFFSKLFILTACITCQLFDHEIF